MNNLKHILIFISIFIVLNTIGTSCKPEAPAEPIDTEHPMPAKSFVACFVNGQPAFSGEIIGPARIVDLNVVTFYSIELDAEVRIVNGGCIEMRKGWHFTPKKDVPPPGETI